MRKYELTNEQVIEMASNFNNTAIGRRIWLYSKIPHILAGATLVFYLMLVITGITNPGLNTTLENFILGDVIVLGISLGLIAICELIYWKEVLKYINEQIPKEEPKKENKKNTTKKTTVKQSKKKEPNKKK